MIHCLSCEKYPTDEKVIPFGSTFPIDTFKVKLISKDSLNEMPTDGTDVVELPDNIKFSVGSKLYIVNGDGGSEVYIYGANGFEAYTECEVITDSNSIMNFETYYAAPLKSLKININPIQDLHGYDNPWPAGGGKNLIDYLSCVGVGSRNGTDSVYNNNTSISGTELTINQSYGRNGGILKGVGTFPLSTGEYVTISGKATLTGTSKLVVGISNYDGGGTNNINADVTVTNGRFSVKLDAKSDYAKTGIFLQPQTVDSTAVVSEVMVALGQTEQPYSPYSNICPISGWTGAMVSRTGKNLVDVDPFTLIMGTSRTKSININPVPVGTYTVSVNVTKNTTTKTTSLSIRDKMIVDYVEIDRISIPAGVTGIVTKTFTANVPFAYIYAYETSSETNGAEVTIEDVQIELGSTATAYEPYTGTTYPVSWETEAGTVYGGTLDVVTGELVVDRASVDLGTLTWSYNGTRFNASISGITLKNSRLKGVCSTYSVFNGGVANAPDKSLIFGGGGDSGIYIKDSTYSDETTFKSAMSGVQLVYELATPTTYHLTPTEVRTLLGANNVWADTGDVTEIKYLKMK